MCNDKSEFSFPTTYFYAFKHCFVTIAKENKDVATVKLSGFFLQDEIDEKDKHYH